MALGHSPQIVTQGLVFYIDPSSTKSYAGFGNTIYDVVNSSIGGTFVGYTSNPIDNTFTRSLAYDGSANYIQTSYIPYYTSDFTIEVWANFSRYNDFQAILSSMDNDNATNGFWFEFGSFRGFTIYSSGAQLVLEDNIVNLSNLELNKWHHIAVSRIGTGTNNIKLYVNNILCGQNTYTAAIGHTSRNMLVGRYAYGGNLYSYFKGNLGLIKIYNRGLTASEILQNFNATRKKYYPEEQIVTDGLILNLDPGNRNSFPGTGNTIYDISGSGIAGTFLNGPSFSTLNGGQINMPGSYKYIDIGQNFNFTSENFSISSWIYLDSYSTINNVGQGPIAFFKGDYQQMGYYCQIDSNGSFGFFTNQSGIRQYSSTAAGIFNLSNWYNLSCVRNGSSVRLYLNGIDVTSVAGTHINPTSSNQSFKINFYKGDYLISGQMRISQFLIYNRALNQQEILQNYNATKNRFVNALPPVKNNLILELDAASVSSYPGTGNTWYDLSGNNLNSSLAGSPTYTSSGSASYITFDANTKSGTLTTSVLNNYSSGTIECSVYITNLTSSFILARQRNGFNSYNVFSVGSYADGGGTLVTGTSGIVYYHNKNAQTVLSSSTALLANTWYRLSITFTTSAVILYINGVQNATVAGDYSVPNEPSTDPRIGAWIKDGTNYPMNGRLAHFTVYNRALSAVEIKQNFDYYRTRYGI